VKKFIPVLKAKLKAKLKSPFKTIWKKGKKATATALLVAMLSHGPLDAGVMKRFHTKRYLTFMVNYSYSQTESYRRSFLEQARKKMADFTWEVDKISILPRDKFSFVLDFLKNKALYTLDIKDAKLLISQVATSFSREIERCRKLDDFKVLLKNIGQLLYTTSSVSKTLDYLIKWDFEREGEFLPGDEYVDSAILVVKKYPEILNILYTKTEIQKIKRLIKDVEKDRFSASKILLRDYFNMQEVARRKFLVYLRERGITSRTTPNKIIEILTKDLVENYTYVQDAVENFRNPLFTLITKEGDCDNYAVSFARLLRETGKFKGINLIILYGQWGGHVTIGLDATKNKSLNLPIVEYGGRKFYVFDPTYFASTNRVNWKKYFTDVRANDSIFLNYYVGFPVEVFP